MAKKHIIWSSLDRDEENWKESFEEHCEINELDMEKEDIYEYISDMLGEYFQDEMSNLSVPCGDILVIADLGLWNGRHSAYKIIRSGKVNGILGVDTMDDAEFYCDQYNVLADIYHHDGCNHLEFREIKKGVNIQPLLDMLYNQEEVSRDIIRRYTKSMRPYIKKVYGFK